MCLYLIFIYRVDWVGQAREAAIRCKAEELATAALNENDQAASETDPLIVKRPVVDRWTMLNRGGTLAIGIIILIVAIVFW